MIDKIAMHFVGLAIGCLLVEQGFKSKSAGGSIAFLLAFSELISLFCKIIGK